jgi:hypothetical protein
MTPKMRAIRERLRALQEEDGFLDYQRVITEARNPDSPMHSYFTWDVQAAAEKRWLDECRTMIRTVKYVETTTKQVLTDVPNYVSVTRVEGRAGCKPLDVVRQSDVLAQNTFNDELNRAIANVRRALAVADVLQMRDQMEQILSQLLQIQERMAA